jgi:hypothetical protein
MSPHGTCVCMTSDILITYSARNGSVYAGISEILFVPGFHTFTYQYIALLYLFFYFWRNILVSLLRSVPFIHRRLESRTDLWPPFLGFLDHTHTDTVGLLWKSNLPVAETSTYTGKHNRQTSMPRAGFEPETPVTKLPQTYTLDGVATTGTSKFPFWALIIFHINTCCPCSFTGKFEFPGGKHILLSQFVCSDGKKKHSSQNKPQWDTESPVTLIKPGAFVCYGYANVSGTRTMSLCDPFCIPQEGCKSPLLWPYVNRTERGDESPLSYGVKSATYPVHCFVEGCPNTESFLLIWGNYVIKLMYASVQTNYSAKMTAFWDTVSVVSLK